MTRRFEPKPVVLGLALVASILVTIGVVAGFFARAEERRQLDEISRQVERLENDAAEWERRLGKRVEALETEAKKTESELRDQIRRMGQRPPRGKIEETFDKFDDPIPPVLRDDGLLPGSEGDD